MKKFAPVAILLGIMSALFFASGTAQANPPVWSCHNGVVGVSVAQICTVDVDVDAVVNVLSGDILSDNDIDDVLEVKLGDVSVLNDNNVANKVVNIYNNDFSIPILSNNVIIVGLPCPCH